MIKVEEIYLNWKKSVNEILDWLGEKTLEFDSGGFLRKLKKFIKLHLIVKLIEMFRSIIRYFAATLKFSEVQ